MSPPPSASGISGNSHPIIRSREVSIPSTEPRQHPLLHPTQFVDSNVSPDVQQIGSEDFYTTDKYADRAVEFIEQNQAKPFFLYLPFNAQHAPLQAPKKYLDRFPNINDPKRKIFAAMMSALDDAVGRVLDRFVRLVRRRTR